MASSCSRLDPRLCERIVQSRLGRTEYVLRRQPELPDDLVVPHDHGLGGGRTGVYAGGESDLPFPGQQFLAFHNGDQRFHPGEQLGGLGPLGERVGDHRKPGMLLDVLPELRPHQRRLGAAEAGGDEHRVGIVVTFGHVHRPGDHQFQLRGDRVETELLDGRVDVLQVHVRIDHLAPDRSGGPLYLVLHSRVLGPAGQLCDLDHFSPSRNAFTFLTTTLASSSLVG